MNNQSESVSTLISLCLQIVLFVANMTPKCGTLVLFFSTLHRLNCAPVRSNFSTLPQANSLTRVQNLCAQTVCSKCNYYSCGFDYPCLTCYKTASTTKQRETINKKIKTIKVVTIRKNEKSITTEIKTTITTIVRLSVLISKNELTALRQI